MKLQDQALDALQQSVVQITGDALPFRETLLHAPVHLPRYLPQPQLVNRTEQQEKGGHG